MRELTRRLATGLMVVALTALAVAPAHAQAGHDVRAGTGAGAVGKAGCHGLECDGRDPQVQGCDDGRNIISKTTKFYANQTEFNHDRVTWLVTWDLRYSAVCDASWTRVTVEEKRKPLSVDRYTADFTAGIWSRTAPEEVRSHYAEARSYSVTPGSDLVNEQWWTDMVQDSPNLEVRSCYLDWRVSPCTKYMH